MTQTIKFKIITFCIILWHYQQFKVETVILKFTKVACKAYDPPYADFSKCYLKAIGRDKVGLNLHVRLHQPPIVNVTINAAAFFKGSNQRYQPFLYNTTADFCKFLKNTNSYPFWKIIYSIVKPKSNVNHTCPYNHDITIENLVLDASMLKPIPFPSGDYMIFIRAGPYKDYKAEARIYIAIKE